MRKATEELEEKEILIKSLKNAPKTLGEPSNEWIMEKNLLKNQIESLKSQIEENKSVKEALVSALQSKNIEPRIEPKDPTKHLNIALEKTEERCQDLEQKVERLKKFEKIFKFSTTLQCKICGKTFASNLFYAHTTMCEENINKIAENGDYIIIVTSILTKDDGIDSRSSTEYTISVTYKGRTWTINKIYKNFKVLESSLQKELPDVEIPDSSLLVPNEIGSIFNNKKQVKIEERKGRFQDYLMALASNSSIKNSYEFRKFMNTDQYFPEESLEKSFKRPGELKNSRKNEYFYENAD